LEDQSFDYGLAPGESFDPDDDREVDRSAPHVMTVLGPIHPGALGAVNLAASFVPRAPGADIAELLNEIQESAAVGLNALVDLGPIIAADEARAALWMAERCDIHLVVGTGIDPDAGVSANVNRIVEEAGAGMRGTRLSPGLIVAEPDDRAVRIALAASEATGLPLVVDTRNNRRIPQIDGEIPRLCVYPNQAVEIQSRLIVDLATTGDRSDALVGIPFIVNNQQVLVGYDPPGRGDSLFSRWNWLIEEFPIALLEAGFDALQARALLVDDPAEFLTITLPAPPRC
jgi:hypothetical protein